MAIEAKKVKSEYKLVKVYGKANRSGRTVRLAQNFSYDQRINPENTREIGDNKFVSTVYDAVTTDISIDTNIGSESFANLLALVGKSAGPVTETDFDHAVVDVAVPTSVDGTTLNNTLWIPAAFLNSVEVQLSTDGLAKENYRFLGGMDEQFINSYKDTKPEVLVSGTYGGSNTVWTSLTAAGSNTPIYLVVDGVTYPSTEFTWVTNTVTLTGIDASGAEHVSLVYAGAGTSFTMITPGASDVGGVKGKTITIEMAYGTTPGDADRVLRLQGVNFSIPMNRQSLNELGSALPFDQSAVYPLEISVNVDALETDLRLYAKIANKTFASDNILNPEMFMGLNGLKLRAVVKDAQGNTLVVYLLDKLRVNGHGKKVGVGENATISWQFICDTVSISAS